MVFKSRKFFSVRLLMPAVQIMQFLRCLVYHLSRVEFVPRAERSFSYSAKRAGTIKHGFGASREKTTRIFNARHVGTRFRARARTHARAHIRARMQNAVANTRRKTLAWLLIQRPEDRERRPAKEQNERRFSRFLRVLNKRKERERDFK